MTRGIHPAQADLLIRIFRRAKALIRSGACQETASRRVALPDVVRHAALDIIDSRGDWSGQRKEALRRQAERMLQRERSGTSIADIAVSANGHDSGTDDALKLLDRCAYKATEAAQC